MASTEPVDVSFDELVARANALASGDARRVLGITGAPGSGKSTLAEYLVSELGDRARLVPLDGFHLADPELRRLGRWERKGALDTFDGAGYVNLLRRLRDPSESVVYAPHFDRDLEAAIAGWIHVPHDVPLIVTEGNYLLVDDAPWHAVRTLVDEVWFVDPGDAVRMERLIARHRRFGRTEEQAVERSYGSDQRNAELIDSTRVKADRVLRLVDELTSADPAQEEIA
jgi:pantothenate kinase